MKAVPYIVLFVSFIPFYMVITFIWVALTDYEKEKKAKEEELNK
jgi:hypothetical protein